MALKDQLPGDLATFLNTDDFAREIVNITQSIVVVAIVEYLDEQSENSRGIASRAKLHMANPTTTINEADEFRWDDLDWSVETVEHTDDNMIAVTVRRNERLRFQ